jgi:hypothetical protein
MEIELEVMVHQLKGAVGLNPHVFHIPAQLIATNQLKLRGRYIVKVGNLEWPCAVIPYNGGDAYISVNKPNFKKLSLTINNLVTIYLKEDKSEYGMPMPEELEALLEQDEMGKMRFDKLTKGKQRNIIYYVSQAKSVQVRIDRAITLIEKLKIQPEEGMDIGALFRKE